MLHCRIHSLGFYRQLSQSYFQVVGMVFALPQAVFYLVGAILYPVYPGLQVRELQHEGIIVRHACRALPPFRFSS